MIKSTRRTFLREAAQGAAVLTVAGSAPQFLLKAAAADAKGGDRVLVVVQLSGGNDGLNTIVPFDNDDYYKNRPKLAVAKNDVLKINDQLGFHPELTGFASLLESDRLAILQGVGYENPNRSHFESMDVWHTCDRKESRREDGWLGRYLDGRPADGGDVGALHLGKEKQPRALLAQKAHALSVSSLDRFRLRDAEQ
ncbi:MAG: Twin-arginine translocation pathway signal sequence domain protein, partial [Pirellulaceae bacterium]|nr:Twin-arginine translocation pathway signal sequence domain protein [Pirellulaceae bacterium]